ncbi:MAG TPA: glycosyltransferase family 2 protein [Candidatus Paceibacterota bacterium]|jgi:Glycosyltransferases involved in cell wall biogenesis
MSYADNHRFSIVIPFYNEEGNVVPVIRETKEALPGVEIVAVNDGSTDSTYLELLKFPDIKVVSFPENRGQGVALYEGIYAASNEHCVLMDGDGQFDPRDAALLAFELFNAHLVIGVRAHRKDTGHTIFFSKIANAVRRIILGDSVTDTGSMKAVRRNSALEHLFPFEGIHRYIPSFFAAVGLSIREIPISHRPRHSGKTKYSHTSRALRGICHLIFVRSAIKTTQKKAAARIASRLVS